MSANKDSSEHVAEAYSAFQQPWWLEATAPGRWGAAVVEENGKVVGRLPYVVEKKGSIRTLTQPKLTQSLGPWIETRPEEATHTKLAREKRIYTALIEQLPSHTHFRQNFAPQVSNWLPFYWQGFSQTTRYTYTLDLTKDDDTLLREMTKSKRKMIRKAERLVEVERTEDVDLVLDLAEMTFGRQGLTLPYSRSYVHRLVSAADIHGAAQMFVARDRKTGQPHASAMVLGDANRMYALISGADPELRQSAAGDLIKWESFKAAREVSSIFDFEGSVMERIESYYRGFGASQVPYFALTKQGHQTQSVRHRAIYWSANTLARLLRA